MILRRASRRWLWRHPWQFGLSIVGVALGVAVVVSIDLANDSALRAFELSRDAVAGRATHRIVGGPRGLDERVFARLRLRGGLRAAAPVLEGWVTLPGGGRPLRLLGVDPLSEGPFRPWLSPTARSLDLGPFMTGPTCLLAPATAAELGVGAGDELALLASGAEWRLGVAGILEPADRLSARALRDLVVVDISTAQELLDRHGRLSHVDVRLEDPDALGDLEALLPDGAELVPVGGQQGALGEMTRAFRVNLTALGLLALICGMFLIYNTTTFSVVQRRQLIGSLRAIGVTRSEIGRLVVGEALVIGAVGSLLGLAAGVVLARGLVGLVTRTINDLYFVVNVRALAVGPGSVLLGGLLGVGATVVAALWPAREATRQPPQTVLRRSLLESAARRASPRQAVAGALLLAVGGAGLAMSGRLLVPSFAALFAIILGFALMTPLAVLLAMRALVAPVRRAAGLLAGMAPRGVAAALSRTGAAIAALMIAISVVIGVAVMIDSFRRAVAEWLDQTLTADLYVSAGTPTDVDTEIRAAPPTLAALEALPQVEGVRTVRRVVLEAAAGRSLLVVFGGQEPPTLDLVAGDPAVAWAGFEESDGVIVSEPYAYRNHVGVGDRIELRTDSGRRAFGVVAVYRSYASDQGIVAMSRETYRRWWDDDAISGLSIYAAADADVDRLADTVRGLLDDPRLVVQPNRGLREASLEVFDRTFLITGVLRMLVTVVAFVGVLGALMSLQLERRREVGVLRAIGLTPRQVWGLVTAQSGLMGLAAGLLALPVGLSLAAVMIFVINRRSFGWSLPMAVSPGILLQALSLAVAAALIAGLYPAWNMARSSTAEALREE